jgi:hypothetical protein
LTLRTPSVPVAVEGPGALGEGLGMRKKEMKVAAVRSLFDRYERVFNRSLRSEDVDLDEVASLYASEFIGASPSGLMTGKNNDQFKRVMAQTYAHYRAMGTKEMRIRDVRLSEIDEHHCLAHVAWTAIYARGDEADTAIAFDVHYLVQQSEREAKVFGWISEDEQELLKQHGIV